MNKKEFNVNIAYLEANYIEVNDEPLWKDKPYSRELYFETPSGGDFSISVEEVTREKVLDYLDDFDVDEVVMLWWENGRHPFGSIKALYEDIEQWLQDFKQIAYNMPY